MSNKNNTKKSKTSKRKTMKNKLENKKEFIVKTFLEMLTTIKLYHWKTNSYAHHKATDELYDEINKYMDEFIEVMLGKNESRINKLNSNIKLHNNNSSDFKNKIYSYREIFIDMDDYLHPRKDTDLLNIRDEILGHINQFLYLSTFK